ncbi:MAG: sugar phosphate isomerase/epimerase family protein [Acidobacteriota bacterium]
MPRRDFGFSQYCTPMWSFEQDLRHFRDCGANCLELSEAKLQLDRLDEQLALLAETELRVSTLQPAVESFFEVKLSATRGNLEANREALYQTVEFMGRTQVADRFNTISGVLPGRTWSEALPTVAREYRELCQRAAYYGIKVMIEPLHPLYCGLDSMISNLDEAAQLIDEVNLDNLGFTFDVWHLWQGASIYRDIQKYKDRIWTVHISDWLPLRCAVDRHVPGEGEIPLGSLLHALEASGYDNGYLVEFFSDYLLPDSLWRQDMQDVLLRCREGFDKAWDSV